MLVNSSSVLMGNSDSCKVVGIRNIKIKMFDGVVRMLGEIRHIQDLRKNLISFGTLDCNGYSYKSASRVMKVSKECSLRQAHTRQREFLTMFIQMFGGQ
ncbi:hypothetical protein I3842_05G177500 [Carya illinoinensis]|uniref:Retrovirus-related Pol polyprotein from transposon TNT 1-94-like beta-barrel domain-containing protein n=1 Tax=Carya illinoinensis TaxID=32201 RepID=A0A922JR52_CARIL|nr:hypothetical protein I3842_05G177500 [Carya illinoinensis]